MSVSGRVHFRDVADEQLVLPVGSPGVTPEDPVGRRARRRRPPQVRVVARGRSVDVRLAAIVHDDRRGRGERERGGDGRVDARVLGEIRGRHAVERVPGIVLPREILARFAEAHRSEAVLVVRRVVAAPRKPVGSGHRAHGVRRHVTHAPPLHEARKLPRRRIFWPFRVHANRRAIDNAVAAAIVADNVVVEHRLDGDALLPRFLRVQLGAHQPLLFGHVTHEHQSRIEVDATLAEDAGQFHRQCRTASVVVDAGRGTVVRRLRVGGLGDGDAVAVARARPAALAAVNRDGVVVAGNVDAPRTPPGQDRHHVPGFHVAGDAALRGNLVRVEAHLKLRAVALHLVEDPPPRRTDAARGRISRRQCIARAEGFKLLQQNDEPCFRHLAHEPHDAGVEIDRRLRGRRPADDERETRRGEHNTRNPTGQGRGNSTAGQSGGGELPRPYGVFGCLGTAALSASKSWAGTSSESVTVLPVPRTSRELTNRWNSGLALVCSLASARNP